MSKLKLLKKTDFRLICYLTGILLSFLVLIGVIVVLTLMVANKELGIIKQICNNDPRFLALLLYKNSQNSG